ncbi:glutamate-rich WD repeat-containing protein 1 [Trichonephila inaurata madagascariensis]|uniref:Glutamate-rich WD repeat-containing protein 1 n=1 Tax=Trichonephila inaurata madagascariensis TaxID=2747483 RepID=A0A8X6MAZ7_9ARAC|nr:glutamate-rich WD repeat-containing protein 1 [Trichonephila inaurata madagascariensis]
MDVAEESSNDDEEVDTEAPATSRVYLPSAENKDEELDYDESAYIFYYAVRTGSPCLSFDILRDSRAIEQISFSLCP